MWDWRHLKTGSSPLARGLPLSAPHTCGAARIIPARAGFTGRRAESSPAGTDHPRSRGVYPLSPILPSLPSGSSPLARGLQLARVEGRLGERIIPARAGFTMDEEIYILGTGDHPRSRGVYTREEQCIWIPMGSSPLARGLRSSNDGSLTIYRIIPARAGFTGNPAGNASRPWDHPRSRGVYSLLTLMM